MPVTPNYAGYKEAQERIRSLLGEAIILLGPVVAVYPDGTAVDPESGEPYNPLIEPTSSAAASGLIQGRVARVGVPSSNDNPSEDLGIGWVERDEVTVICSSAAASAAVGAVGMVIRDERYEIRAARFDGIAGTDRYLIFGSKDNQ